jgi:hypothetical protein
MCLPHSWLIIGIVTRVTRWVPLMEQELLTVSEWGSCHSIFSFHCVALCIVVCPFVLFQLVIVLSVLPFIGSDSPFSIFKFFQQLTSKYTNDFNISHLWIYLEVKYITYYLTLLLILRYEDILRNEIWWLSTFSWDLIHKVINPHVSTVNCLVRFFSIFYKL